MPEQQTSFCRLETRQLCSTLLRDCHIKVLTGSAELTACGFALAEFGGQLSEKLLDGEAACSDGAPFSWPLLIVALLSVSTANDMIIHVAFSKSLRLYAPQGQVYWPPIEMSK